MALPTQPALIGLDWCTSSLRGYLIADDGSVLESITRPWGIRDLPAGGFEGAFRATVGAWRDSWQGWREVAHVDCPADADSVASGPAGITGRLFTTRSLFLNGDLKAAATLDYLSGLLVGEEVRSAAASFGGNAWPPLVLVGDEQLCSLYGRALSAFGVDLWQIAKAAGIVSVARDPSGSAKHG